MSQKKGRRKWTPAQKLQIVLETLQSDRKLAQICRREGVSPNLVYQCRKQLLASADVVFTPKRRTAPNPQVEQLETGRFAPGGTPGGALADVGSADRASARNVIRLASERQRNYIASLFDELGWDAAKAAGWLRRRHGIRDLAAGVFSSAAATDVIVQLEQAVSKQRLAAAGEAAGAARNGGFRSRFNGRLESVQTAPERGRTSGQHGGNQGRSVDFRPAVLERIRRFLRALNTTGAKIARGGPLDA